MPLKNGPSTRRRLVPAALTALALPLAAGAGIGAAPAGAASMGDMAGMPGMAMTAHAAVPTPTPATAAPTHPAAAPRGSAARTMFRVGTPTHPLMENGPDGPLWSATPPSVPGRAAHGTFGAIYVAEQLARAADERATALGITPPHRIQATASTAATSGVLTTAQASKQLSRSCQKLIKAKPGKLSKADRKKRTKCIAQRDALVAASKKKTPSPSPTPTPTPMPAPTAPIQGPSPVGSTTPQATPTPTPAASGGIDPSTVVCSAVGVTAIDIQPFALTRGVACTSTSGSVTFQLTNRDSQVHGIAIKPAGADDSAAVPIIPELAKQSGPVSQSVALKPGSYTLICTVKEHNPAMEVDLKILTKADYIAQGYAG